MATFDTIRLTTTQSQVLMNAITAPTPVSARSYVDTTPNAQQAMAELSKLGLVTMTDTELEVTDEGQALARNLNLVDDQGQPTPVGQQYVAQPDENGPEPGMGDLPQGPQDDMPFEAEQFRLIKTLLQ